MPDAERLAAGDQELHLGALVEQLGRHPGGRRDLLEVVEHQQDLPLAQALGQLLADRAGGRLPHPDRATDAPGAGRRRRGRPTRRRTRRRRGTASTGRAAARMARLVLPVPPGPVSVSSRIAGSPRQRSTASSSARRPTNAVVGIGRLAAPWSMVVSGGKVDSRSGWTSWKTRSGRPRSLSRNSPRSRRLAPAGRPSAQSAAAAADSRTWPP